MKGAALEGSKAFADERLLAVDEHGLFRAVPARPLRNRVDVRLVVLSEVGREGVGDRAMLAHPRERAAGVEPAGEGDADALAGGQRAEDHTLPRSGDAHAAPLSRCELSSSASSAPVIGSRETSSMVFSPAIVPATWGWCATSIA